jgi:hypothetical protein
MEVSVLPELPPMVEGEAELGLSTTQLADLASAHEHQTKEVRTGNRELLLGLRNGTAEESQWEPPLSFVFISAGRTLNSEQYPNRIGRRHV